jgi:iron complex outermembrane receptor protein
MKPVSFKTKVLSAAISCLAIGAISVPLQVAAQELIEEVVTTGMRGQPRTVSDSPVPVDVFSASEIEAVSYTDTNNILQTLVPSYNVARQPISDGATFIRPATLRGLPTDKTLVLVNGKRRHRAALVSIGGSGTQGPDVATIPGSAIKSVEVLRDGAAAQYGSDAIAGVINFTLKDNREGGSISVDTGKFYEGDGKQYTVTGNIGLPLGSKGFVSVSGEVSKADATVRAIQYCTSSFCLDQSNPNYNPNASYTKYTESPTFIAAAQAEYGDVVQRWGQPNAEAKRLFANAGLPITADMELYAFASYSESEGDGDFNYRFPNNSTIRELREPDGSIYFPLEKHPGGYTPRFFGAITDYSWSSGLRGKLGMLDYDLNGRYGYDEISYTLSRTINPSMGPESPTSMKPGDLINEETQFQGDFGLEMDMGLASPAYLAFGLSYMDESYEVVKGQLESYAAGPYAFKDPWDFCNDDGTATSKGLGVIANGSTLNCANPGDPVYTVVGVGSDGFPGYPPQFSEVYSRDSYAAYLDLSADVTDRLFLQAALRYEDYSDFDSELVGKIAGKFDITDTLGIRASFGTGFRAPTPGQQGTINVSTRLPNGVPVATGLFPANGPVASSLGATPLKPETSTNYTLGLTYSIGALDLTMDYYRIEMEDLMRAVSTLTVSTDPTAGVAYDRYLAMVAGGVAGADTIGGVLYFTNAFNTTTQGLDIVATYPLEWNGMMTSLTGSLNYNESSFDTDPSKYLNPEDTSDFLNQDPKLRAVLSARHTMDDLTLVARSSYYGVRTNSNLSGGKMFYQDYHPIWMFDLEMQYQINESLSLTLGGRNIFDAYPEKDTTGDATNGRIYDSGTVVDWQGGYYFLQMNASF